MKEPSTNNFWISQQNLSANIPFSLNRQTSVSKFCQMFRQQYMLNLNPSLPLITLPLLTLLYSISFILESLLLFAKTLYKNFSYLKFEKCIKSSIYFNFWKSSFKIYNKGIKWFDWHYSGVFIVNFRDVGIENLFEHLRWRFFAKIVNKEKQKFSTGL